jgi:hypothetical protein
MIFDSSPSLHSRVAIVMNPYSSEGDTDLGFRSWYLVLRPRMLRAPTSVFQHWLFPAPAGPMMNTQ